MSGTQTVVHSSREANFCLNFSSSENNLSWAFTAENDGEIFNDSKTNIASYTINGSSVTLPYSLTGGYQYLVSVTKTTNGQTASLTLKTRRAINKSITLSVPDFGAYSGRYVYILLNNTIQKLDSQLLLPSNYAGSGAWTVSPIVSTITLPTLPNSATYTRLHFVKNGGVEKILIVGQSYVNPTTYFYASYLNLTNDTVYDLTLTTQNSQTLLFNIAAHYGGVTNLIRMIQYDYVNELVYILSGIGVNGSIVLRLNLATNNVTNLGYDQFAWQRMTEQVGYEHQFSPIDQQFISIGDYSLINNRTYNYKPSQNSGNIWGYRYRTNARIATGTLFGIVNYFNSSGVKIGIIDPGRLSVYTNVEMYNFDRTNTVFMTSTDNYSIVNQTNTTAKIRQTDKELASPNNWLINLRQCYYSNIYLAFCGNSSRQLSTRMIVFKEDQTNADFGYLDFANTIYSADTNQLLA